MDGGLITILGFMALDLCERQEIRDYLSRAKFYEEYRYDEKRYILVHAGISGFNEDKPLRLYRGTDFIYERMDYFRRYYSDKSVRIVSGHTPTPFIVPDYDPEFDDFIPEIYHGYGHIAIDCGCVLGGCLAAYCIETRGSFYVHSLQ